MNSKILKVRVYNKACYAMIFCRVFENAIFFANNAEFLLIDALNEFLSIRK